MNKANFKHSSYIADPNIVHNYYKRKDQRRFAMSIKEQKL